MYLLDGADDRPRVDELRAPAGRARRLGGAGRRRPAAWNVHVHCHRHRRGDRGRPRPRAGRTGSPSSGSPTRSTPRRRRRPVRPTDRAVLLVAAGAERRPELARSAGAVVLERRPGRARRRSRAPRPRWPARGARHVVLLPDDPELTAGRRAGRRRRPPATGRRCWSCPRRRCCRGWPRSPCTTRDRRPGDDVVAMAEAAAGTRTGGAGRGRGRGADLGGPLRARRRAGDRRRRGRADRPRPGCRGAVVGSPHAHRGW